MLLQKRNPSWVYLNGCYWVVDSGWEVVGQAGFGSLLGELLDLLALHFHSMSSSEITVWRLMLIHNCWNR